jgi:hypothetical protein
VPILPQHTVTAVSVSTSLPSNFLRYHLRPISLNSKFLELQVSGISTETVGKAPLSGDFISIYIRFSGATKNSICVFPNSQTRRPLLKYCFIL